MLKQSLATVLLLCLACRIEAQVKLINLSLTKPDSNVLFLDVDNRLKVTGTAAGPLTLASTNGIGFDALPDNEFICRTHVLQPTIVKVFQKNKLIYEKNYRVDSIQRFRIQVGGIRSDTASVTEIIANKGLITINENPLFKSPFTVVGFQITGTTSMGDTLFQKIASDANIFSVDQAINIRRLKKFNKLVFHDTRVIGPGSRIRVLDPFTILIR